MNSSVYNESLPVRLYRILILNPLGLDRQTAPVLWLLVFFCALLGLSLWQFDGEIPVTVTAVYVCSFVIIAFIRPDIALYTFVFFVILFDQLQLPGFEPITYDVMFFHNIKEISYLPLDVGGINPVEFHLFLMLFAWFILFSANKKIDFVPIPVWPAFALFIGWFGLSFVYGILTGGEFLVALWEIRATIYLAIMYVLVPQIIRTKKQIYILFWIIIATITIKAIQGMIRYVSLGFSTEGYEALTNNEEPVLMVTIIILLLAFFAMKINTAQRTWLLIFLIPIILGFYAGQRRASFASLMVTFGAFVLLLPPDVQFRFIKRAMPVVLILMIYGAVFWNSNSPLAQPVQMVKSGMVTPDKYENMRDYHSNLYREIENYNLSVTAKENTLLGVGFGNKYEMPVELVNINFPLRDYIPHNQIFWVYVKTGLIGFILFWFFFNAFAFQGVITFMRLKDPYLKAVALVIVIAVLNQMVVSYYDVMLTFYRNMIYLGCLMGLLPALIRISKREENEEAKSLEST